MTTTRKPIRRRSLKADAEREPVQRQQPPKLTTAAGATKPETNWEETRRGVKEWSASVDKLRLLYIAPVDWNGQPGPKMHAGLEPSTVFVVKGKGREAKVVGFATRAGLADDESGEPRFWISWDICGHCRKHVLRCRCPDGSIPMPYVPRMVREMSDPTWPNSTGEYVGVIAMRHDPDNPGLTLPMEFDNPPGSSRHTAITQPATNPRRVIRRAAAGRSGAATAVQERQPEPVDDAPIQAPGKRRVIKRH